MLTAIQHNTEQPVLQLANLHGDIVATASNSETATTLASTVSEASEYGVPATEAPPKYSWLGAHQLPTTLPSGTIAMGIRSYIPQLGRYLQPDPIPGGSANSYAYVYGDPMSTSDLTGEYTWGFASYLTETLDQHGAELAQAYEAEVRAEAERLAAQAAAEAKTYADFETESPEEEWEWEEEEEEWGEEYAAFGPGPGTGEPEAHLEDGVLYQALGAKGQSEGGARYREISGNGCPQLVHGHCPDYKPKHSHGKHKGSKPKKQEKRGCRPIENGLVSLSDCPPGYEEYKYGTPVPPADPPGPTPVPGWDPTPTPEPVPIG